MIVKSLNLFKLVFYLCFFIAGIYFFNQGKSILKKENSKINNQSDVVQIKKEKINNLNTKIFDKEKNIELSIDEILLKKDNIKEENLEEKIISVKKNDTFSKIINPFFDDNNIKNLIINKLNEEFDLKKLRIGQKIYFYSNKENKIKKIIVPSSFTINIVLLITSDSVTIKKEKINTTKEINSVKFIISSSLYKDGREAGVPLSILNEAIKLYSYDIDFQRDIQKNSEFKISYVAHYSKERKDIFYGNIEYINLIIQNKNLEYFHFITKDGFSDFFDNEGKNVKKSLLKTPIDGAKLSSSFGMRKHPILDYNKLHKGVDFAAPKGTPIFAGGNGVIDYVGNNGGYGKYIRIRHNNEYKTAYAHLSNFNKNIVKGKRVNQGDIIGYVGNTGNSTGPHLHYEILYKNKQINPMKMKLPPRKTLKGDELHRFKTNTKNIYAKYLFALYE